MGIDPLRHIALFDPMSTNGVTCSVVGCGGLGTPVVEQLCRLGHDQIEVWDPDKVEPYNLGNQLFVEDDIGSPKVAAIARRAQDIRGKPIVAQSTKVTPETKLGEVVFMCVDSMTSRREIMEACSRNPSTLFVVDGRIDASHVVVYALDPNDKEQLQMWCHYWHPDSEAENDAMACGGKMSVIYTPLIAAGLMINLFVRFHAARLKQGGMRRTPNVLAFDLNTYRTESSCWKDD